MELAEGVVGSHQKTLVERILKEYSRKEEIIGQLKIRNLVRSSPWQSVMLLEHQSIHRGQLDVFSMWQLYPELFVGKEFLWSVCR